VEDGDEAVTAEDKTAVLELFRNTAALFGTRCKPAGRDIQLQVETGPAPTGAPSATYWLQANLPAPVVLEVCLNDALLASLQMTQARPSISPAAADGAKNQLGMLMDVELVVTMRFGGRRMLLKDILDLCAGSVVELDQQVQEPVDLLLDGKLIAQGEVVVVDGNYGLRVTELPSNAG
jgi:flagellar motor switch protein FliN